jgi:hypothetical protein
MFSLAHALFFPGSAEHRASLFVWFIDSIARSDSPERTRPPCGFVTSRTGLLPVRAEALQGSPGYGACCFSACAGSQNTQDRLLALSRNSRRAFLHQERVGVLLLRFSKLNSPAHRYPYLGFERHLTASRKTQRQDGVAVSL